MAQARRSRRVPRPESLFPYLVNPAAEQPKSDACADLGWGRVLFAQTFKDVATLVQEIRAEGEDQRDIAMYVTDPHVILAAAPAELFLDPSHTYRLNLATYRPSNRRPAGFSIRRINPDSDGDAVNRLYSLHQMVPVPSAFFADQRREEQRLLTHLVAEDSISREVIGTVTGIDHSKAFDDPERGSSLWSLAVDPQASHPGVGEALIRWLVEHYQTRGASYLDLSVFHDNLAAIRLYEKLGFRRLPLFAVKRRNVINERLFSGHDPAESMNPYARIIIDEARRRGIGVEIIDSEGGMFQLRFGGRRIRCRESLTDLTTAVSLAICDDKATTRRVVSAAGVRVPDQVDASDREAVATMLAREGSLVVKPARGEQGRGVAVDLTRMKDVEKAIAQAASVSSQVLVEPFHRGEDLRLIVIGYKLVAAAIRRPAQVTGDGRHTVRELIAVQSRRRAASTGGESTIPLDGETERCVGAAGFGLDDIPPEGVVFAVRKAANLHTGGTIHDVTDQLHPDLAEAAIRAARAIEIPVVGIDFIVPDPSGPDYVFIEANERPGLANHEPQPTAERFIDLLFPLSSPSDARPAPVSANAASD